SENCIAPELHETENRQLDTGNPKLETRNWFYGGERGIRTPDTLPGIRAFEARGFNHSPISPRRETADAGIRCLTLLQGELTNALQAGSDCGRKSRPFGGYLTS